MPSEHDKQRFRTVFGHFPTGVAVVSVLASDGPIGMTANAVCSLSLEPLLALVCFDNESRTLSVVQRTRRFGVNVLRAGHDRLSGVFASKIPEREKFDGVEHRLEHGVPILADALAWLACDLRQLIPAGDHTIGVGAVAEMGHSDGEPLLWYRGAYHRLTVE